MSRCLDIGEGGNLGQSEKMALKDYADGGVDEQSDIRALFSFNLQRLASVSTKIAQISLSEEFGLTTQEWRTLAVLHFLKRANVNELANNTNIQKSQMSRLITQLEADGLMEREVNPEDGRSTLLCLTDKGLEIVLRVLSVSSERNERMLEGLSQVERVLFMSLIERVLKTSRTYLEECQSQ